MPKSVRVGRGRKRGGGGGGGGGRAETSIAARLQIHGKPPHEGSWQQLSILEEGAESEGRGREGEEEREEGEI